MLVLGVEVVILLCPITRPEFSLILALEKLLTVIMVETEQGLVVVLFLAGTDQLALGEPHKNLHKLVSDQIIFRIIRVFLVGGVDRGHLDAHSGEG